MIVEVGSLNSISFFRIDFREEVETSIRESPILQEGFEEHELYLAPEGVVFVTSPLRRSRFLTSCTESSSTGETLNAATPT